MITLRDLELLVLTVCCGPDFSKVQFERNCAYELAENPDQIERLIKEIKSEKSLTKGDKRKYITILDILQEDVKEIIRRGW